MINGIFTWLALAPRRVRACLFAALITLTGVAGAQGDEFLRFRVAVLDFDVNDITGTLFEPERLGRAMATEFETPLGQSRRFVVITRLDLEKVLDELALGPTGVLKPEQVQAFGEIAGVNIIITGNITVFSPTSYSISAKFIDVSTGELVDAETLRVGSPEEFFVIAKQFVDRALVRFPLRGSVFAVEGDAVYINVGIEHGLTTTDETGVIYRPREVEGRSIPLRIGTFRVKQVYENLALIEPVLEGGYTLMEGDLVTIQPVPVAPAPPTGSGAQQDRGAEDAAATPDTAPGALSDATAGGQSETGEPPQAAHDPSEEPAVAPVGEPAGPQRAWVRFNVDPDYAAVFVDEQLVSPQFELEPGRYRIAIRAEGFQEQVFDLQVVAGARIDRRIVLELMLTSVYFDVVPGNALLWVDDEPVEGIAALLAPGRHELRAEAEEYEPLLQEFEVRAGKIELIEVRLVPILASSAAGGETRPQAPGATDAAEASGQPRRPETSGDPNGSLEVRAPIGTVIIAQRHDGFTTALPAIDGTLRTFELPPGNYTLTLLAPTDASWRAELPPSQVIAAEIQGGELIEVIARGYLELGALPPGVVAEASPATGSGGPVGLTVDGATELEAGVYTVRFLRDGVMLGASALRVEPWQATSVRLPAAVGALEETAPAASVSGTPADSGAGEEPAEAVAAPAVATAPGARPGSTSETPLAAEGENGLLRLVTNVTPVTYRFSGTDALIVEGVGQTTEVEVAPGLYTITASVAGQRDIEEILYIDRGGIEQVSFSFEASSLMPVMGVLGTSAGERLFLRVVSTGRQPGSLTARITGPTGWNGNSPYSVAVDPEDQFTVLERAGVARGDYDVELFYPGQLGVSSRVQVASALQPGPVTSVSATVAWPDLATVQWAPLPWATRYEVQLSGPGGSWSGLAFGASGTVTLTLPGFRNGAYEVCVTAHNWDASATASLSGGQLLSSRSCSQTQLISQGVSAPDNDYELREPTGPGDREPPPGPGSGDLPPPIGPPP